MRNEELLLEFFPLHILHWSSHKGRSISDYLMSSWCRCLFDSPGLIVLVEQSTAETCDVKQPCTDPAAGPGKMDIHLEYHTPQGAFSNPTQDETGAPPPSARAGHCTKTQVRASRKRWKGTSPLWNDVHWVSADFLAENFPLPSLARQCWHAMEGGAAATFPPRSAREEEKQAGHICSSLVQCLAACKSHAGEKEGSLPSPGSTAGPSMKDEAHANLCRNSLLFSLRFWSWSQGNLAQDLAQRKQRLPRGSSGQC